MSVVIPNDAQLDVLRRERLHNVKRALEVAAVDVEALAYRPEADEAMRAVFRRVHAAVASVTPFDTACNVPGGLGYALLCAIVLREEARDALDGTQGRDAVHREWAGRVIELTDAYRRLVGGRPMSTEIAVCDLCGQAIATGTTYQRTEAEAQAERRALLEAGRGLATLLEEARSTLGDGAVDLALIRWMVAVSDARRSGGAQ